MRLPVPIFDNPVPSPIPVKICNRLFLCGMQTLGLHKLFVFGIAFLFLCIREKHGDFGQSPFFKIYKFEKWMDDENYNPEGQTHNTEMSHSIDDINQLYLEVAKAMDEIMQLLENQLYAMKLPKQEQWMTSCEVQKHLRISKLTLKRYRENHQIRFITIYGRFRYHYDDVRKLLIDS
jgi:hypothetical protein